jgi:hypothetical protein
MDYWLTIRSFVAFFFVLFGVAVMAGAPDQRSILGALFTALGLTFFWRLWVAMRTGK